MIPLVSVFSLVALTLGYLWRNAHLTLKLKFLFRGRELIEDLSIQVRPIHLYYLHPKLTC